MSEIPVREMIKKSIVELGGKASNKQIFDWIEQKYPYTKEKTIAAHLYALSVNVSTRIHSGRNNKPRPFNSDYDFLYKLNKNDYELYDPKKHGNYELMESDGKTVVTKNGIPIIQNLESTLLKFLKETMSMQANYQPIILKILLEKGEDNGFSASLQEIKDNLKLLNFDRQGFRMDDALRAVSSALTKFVEFDNETVSLIPEEIPHDVSECLKICGQKIARWHVYDLTSRQFDLWSILPGSSKERHPYLDEFLKTNSVGIGWEKIGDISNLTEEQTRNEFKKYYPEDDEGSFLYFTRIKQKDLIVLTRGMQEIVDFGIVVSNYHHQNVSFPSYPHRRNVVWLNQGPIKPDELPSGDLAGFMTTCSKVIKRRDEMMDALLGKRTRAALKAHSCFILTQNLDSKYDDIEGEQHHYSNNVPNSRKLLEDAKFIIQSKINNENYFVGYGRIKQIEQSEEINEKGKTVTHFVAKFSEYGKFDQPKLRTREIFEEMKSMKSYGNMAPSILPITRQLYAKIIGEDIDDIQVKKPEMKSEFSDILLKKKQLIFYGPPGTGKTYTATKLANEIIQNNSSKSTLTFRAAAMKILHDENRAMHYEEITKKVLEQGLVQTQGETPHFSLLKEMSHDIQKNGESSIFKRIDKGTYSLNPNIELEEIKETEKSQHQFIRNVTFHQSYSYEEFVEGIKPHSIDGKVVYTIEPGIFRIICEDAAADPDNKYVMIIDEINRGNISKIFGELITLIEKDKRGKHTLQLAYSKDTFTVPENIYIIGTMNTADRSLIQIDAALRRRFAFCELMPKAELLLKSVDGISLQILLEVINKRIIESGLREKQIGHSYLMNINSLEDLQFVFANEIVPLLQDYFFDDYKKLEEDILSSDFVDSEKMVIKETWKKDAQTFLDALKNTFQA
jgi:DNA replication protein DnaC